MNDRRGDLDGDEQEPIVSVVIATYRRPQELRRAIASVVGQTLAALEVIVVVESDDDDSPAVLHSVDDDRVRLIRNAERQGPGAARDHGVTAARAPWVAFLDDDDEWLPTKLERQLATASGLADAIVMTLSTVVTAAGKSVQPAVPFDGRQPLDEWLFGRQSWFGGGQSMLQTSSLMMPARLFSALQFGNSRHEEWELVIRATKCLQYELLTVHEPLVVYRAGNTYAWRRSIVWVDGVRDLLSPRAYAGFCLTVATQGVVDQRNRAMTTFLVHALRRGRPTGRQLFAFALIWLVPDRRRQRIRTWMAAPRTQLVGTFRRPYR